MAAITLASTWNPNPTCLQAADLWVWDWGGANDDAHTVLGGPSQTSADCFPTTWAPTLTYVGGPCPQEYTSACRSGGSNPVTTCCPIQYDMSCNTSPSTGHGSYFHCVTAVSAAFPATVAHTYFTLSTTNILTMEVESGQHVLALGMAYKTPIIANAETTPAQTTFPTRTLAVNSETSRRVSAPPSSPSPTTNPILFITNSVPNTTALASNPSDTASIISSHQPILETLLSLSTAVAQGTSGLESSLSLSSTSQQPLSSAAPIVAAATAESSDLSTGAKIGITVGFVLGVGLMTLVACWWLSWRRLRLREQRAGWRGSRRKSGGRRPVLSVQSFFSGAWPPNMASTKCHAGAAGTTIEQPMAEMTGETTGRRCPSAAAVQQLPWSACKSPWRESVGAWMGGVVGGGGRKSAKGRVEGSVTSRSGSNTYQQQQQQHQQGQRAAASALRLKSMSPGGGDAIGFDMSATGPFPALTEMPVPTHVGQPRWPLLQRHRHQRQANSPLPPTTTAMTAMTASRGAMLQMAPAASTEHHPHEWGEPPAYESPSGWPSETLEGQQHDQASYDAFDDNKAAWSPVWTSVARGEEEDYSHYYGYEKTQEAWSAAAVAQGQAELPERAELPGCSPVVVEPGGGGRHHAALADDAGVADGAEEDGERGQLAVGEDRRAGGRGAGEQCSFHRSARGRDMTAAEDGGEI